LPVSDIDRTVAWYEAFTPLVVLDRREDPSGKNAWLCHEGQVENPFVLVLVMFNDDTRRHRTLGPFAHLGFEFPNRESIDEIADKARQAGCLVWEPAQLPAPIGYICALEDPDGNVVECSYDQGVFAKVEERWGRQPLATPPDRRAENRAET